MRRSLVLAAATPIAAALLTLAAVAGLGLSARSNLPAFLEPLSYGFFLDRYPLFAFAIVYGLARIVAAAAMPGPASWPRRVLFAVFGLGLLSAVSLYPTFGGLVLRAGFSVGGVAFLNHQPMMIAYAIGAAAAAITFGVPMGLAIVLANRRFRSIRRGLVSAILSGLALWFGAALLGLGRDEGIGPWPQRAFTAGEALRAAAILLMAALPHAVVTAYRAASVGVAAPARRGVEQTEPFSAR